jgi:predicted deacetylase
MKTFKVSFTIDDMGDKRRGEMEVKANSSNEAQEKLRAAIESLTPGAKVTIVTSNEI